ncbi:alpha-N-arabinofuranosidase [Alkalibacterium putridalgicola]|uniref:Alpha-N-arabinofuranosidase n=1 Tax=Alkalibacterium putridalgicola TaxID=426703 RepID=A0A1H7RBN6_9LACT|nr:glycoside hydrolase family 43 protein [Alkalibacterium putridalgicola]GEK88821.1 xylosidase/arabinosidase [Alkalibacterium putridalgicola]SEL57696.1 alpha-N-arabinofuranosidase [Alkalibacterium putridalgicola]
MSTFTNPILKGFSPDPSVCAVGEDYYLVTSTFSYFPGVPIYHSKDLVNWKQIGNILDRKEQLPLEGAGHSRGIFAPTLRYHNGMFYMITTNVDHGGNFIVTAEKPEGPWSDPYWLKDAPGIDPSLFFDDDGKCYYTGTRPNPEGPKYNGDWEVWLQELDLETMQLTGVSTKIWAGAMKNAIWPEGPHLYKKDGYYYVMIAEGGTGYNHSITIARSERIDGHYEGYKNNPILTHRHLGKAFPVHNVGHGDLVETPDGQWFLTCLASRIFDGYSNLGRETFLAKVEWEDGWPVVNPGIGRLLAEQEHSLPMVPVEQQEQYDLSEDSPAFMYLRHPQMENYDRKSRAGWLRLHATSETLKDLSSPTYLGLRQQAMNYTLTTQLDASSLANDKAEVGLAVVQNDRYAIRLVASPFEEGFTVRMITTIDGVDEVVGEVTGMGALLELSFIGEGQQVKALVKDIESGREDTVAENIDTHYLSTEVAGGFVGCTMGLYVTSDNKGDYADFNWLEQKITK